MFFQINTQPLVRSTLQTIRYYSAKSASSKRWIQRAQSDHYTKEAQYQQFKSRAAFKLMQLDDKFSIFSKGQNVVDLGFAPGAWTQVAITRTKPHAHILGVDIIPAKPPTGASAMQANILSKKTHTLIRNYFLDPKDEIESENVLDHPSYIEAELRDNPHLDEVALTKKSRFPIDVVISDMYDPIIPPDRFWNNTTNMAFHRMANTSGLIAKDHHASIVSIPKLLNTIITY